MYIFVNLKFKPRMYNSQAYNKFENSERSNFFFMKKNSKIILLSLQTEKNLSDF